MNMSHLFKLQAHDSQHPHPICFYIVTMKVTYFVVYLCNFGDTEHVFVSGKTFSSMFDLMASHLIFLWANTLAKPFWQYFETVTIKL
jgi:hypothetical protein